MCGDRRRSPWLMAAAAVALCSAAQPLAAQQTRELDAGNYEIRVEGRRVGSEQFAVRREGRDVRAVGRIDVDTATSAIRPMETGMRAGSDFAPELFRIRLREGDVQSVVAIREEGRLRLQVTSSRGDRWKEFVAPDGLSILEPRLAHHWYLVLRQHADALGQAGRVRVSAVDPLERMQMELEIRREGPEAVDLPGARRSAIRYTATLGDRGEARIWTDEEGRVLRVTIPGRGWISVRLPGDTRP